ncbi:hypothetical protein G2W53_018146 [Senna tora]|uniref:Reverse transcriptase zinc-binding domain-containing protein n=1 Tax=Senna tora TaxID=362788 RepID=A0A834TS47_9FABA|nr:hypothetical protein G2W53_018146 [Senna tora]
MSHEDEEATVALFTTASGAWNWGVFENLIPPEICLKVRSIPPPSNDDSEDKPVWSLSKDGNFSTKSAYMLIKGEQDLEDVDVWKKIWKWKGPEKIKYFMWLCVKDRVLTNVNRRRRNLSLSDLCPRCRVCSESVLHMVRDCNYARNVWLRLVRPNMWPRFFNCFMIRLVTAVEWLETVRANSLRVSLVVLEPARCYRRSSRAFSMVWKLPGTWELGKLYWRVTRLWRLSLSAMGSRVPIPIVPF